MCGQIAAAGGTKPSCCSAGTCCVTDTAGNEQCSLFGEHVFVLVVLFGVWCLFLNVFGLCSGVFGVWCSGAAMLCLVFTSCVVFCAVFGPPSSQGPVPMIITRDQHIR